MNCPIEIMRYLTLNNESKISMESTTTLTDVKPSPSANISETHTKEFFQNHEKRQDVYMFLANELRRIFTDYDISHTDKIIDVGCGNGYLVKNLLLLGFNAFGIDGSNNAQEYWSAMRERFDVKDVCDANTMIDGNVILSFEVGEHLPKESASTYIGNLTRSNPKLIVFSAATPFQDYGRNPLHINEQPFEYWLNLFHERGFHMNVEKTLLIRERMLDNMSVYMNVWWYPKNILIIESLSQESLLSEGNSQREYTIPNHVPRLGANSKGMDLLFERDHYMLLYNAYRELSINKIK